MASLRYKYVERQRKMTSELWESVISGLRKTLKEAEEQALAIDREYQDDLAEMACTECFQEGKRANGSICDCEHGAELRAERGAK